MPNYQNIAEIIMKAKNLIVFTGAGISKESGIPPFRGKDGIWNKFNPDILEINNYFSKTEENWVIIKSIFYDFFESANPNIAHYILAEWEQKAIVKHIITQNIDSLHQKAGSNNVIEYHGTNSSFICLNCSSIHLTKDLTLSNNIPTCAECGGILKLNFIFFGELIPTKAREDSLILSETCDLVLIIGSTGEVYPAAQIPFIAKRNGAKIIEINPETSAFTNKITDFFIKEKASIALEQINNFII
jgi:NAD-dependent deacetylase